MRTIGTTAQQFPFVDRRKLRRARALAEGTARETLLALRAWDGNYATDRCGRHGRSRRRDLGGAQGSPRGGPAEGALGEAAPSSPARPGLSHQFDISNGESVALRTLGGRAYARAARATARRSQARFGSADPGTWREQRRMYEVGAMGAGSSPDLPFFDRGTWEHAVSLGP